MPPSGNSGNISPQLQKKKPFINLLQRLTGKKGMTDTISVLETGFLLERCIPLGFWACVGASRQNPKVSFYIFSTMKIDS